MATQDLPHSLGLLYEELTEFLGFRRASDEYKVMALAAYGRPRLLDFMREAVRLDGRGGFVVEAIDWASLDARPEDIAASVQIRLQEVLRGLAQWIHEATGEVDLAMAGGVALNCVANSDLAEHGPFRRVWVQPAAGDSGTALGAALLAAGELGDRVAPMTTASLGRGWDDAEIAAALDEARVPYVRPPDIAAAAADVIARDGIVAWFQGRSEYGPRALGNRSLLADPRNPANIDRLNAVKGREPFRPVAPMVLLDRASEIFDGPLPSPFMLFTHRVRDAWRDRIPAAMHVDGTARVQTVDPVAMPLVGRLLEETGRRTGVPVVINTSLNTAGRPMVERSPGRDGVLRLGSG